MSAIVPPKRPEMAREFAEQLMRAHGVEGFALVGRRGYYRDTMGKVGENDRGIYDDVIALVTPTFYGTFNANTDPSRGAPGMAVLKAGVWQYRIGIHGITRPAAQRYEALVQAEKVTVRRDGQGDDTGWFGINIHKGSRLTTGSLGCQTIHPDQWASFIHAARDEMARHGRTTIPYVLTEREETS